MPQEILAVTVGWRKRLGQGRHEENQKAQTEEVNHNAEAHAYLYSGRQ